MNNSKPEQTFPFDKNTLVVLTAKCPEGAAILKQSGAHWFAKPLPRQLQDDNLTEVFKGWLYLRSALSQHRFVHVINDRLFDVAFETKDSVVMKDPSPRNHHKRKEMLMSNDRFYLNCAYDEKDDCKSLGGWWDNDARKCYVPNDVDRNLFKKWWPKNSGSNTNVFPIA